MQIAIQDFDGKVRAMIDGLIRRTGQVKGRQAQLEEAQKGLAACSMLRMEQVDHLFEQLPGLARQLFEEANTVASDLGASCATYKDICRATNDGIHMLTTLQAFVDQQVAALRATPMHPAFHSAPVCLEGAELPSTVFLG